MGILDRMLGFGGSMRSGSGSIENPSVPLSQATLDDLFGDGYESDAGEGVTPLKALGYAPVYQAVAKISGDCAKLPLSVFKRDGDDGRVIDPGHRVSQLINLKGSPNDEINAFKFWRRFFVSALLWNNAWAWIERNVNGDPIALYHLLPDRTCWHRQSGRLTCATEVGGKLWGLPKEDVLHIEGVCIDGQQGAKFITLFRHDFGLALAARKFTSKFFSGGANIGGVLQVPPGTKPENVKKVQGSMAEKFAGGSNAFKTLVLRDGYRWFATGVDPSKASVDRIDERQTMHVAQMYNMDPSHLGVRGSVSYNSREQAKQDYHDSTLSPWLIGTKAECNLKLLSERERSSNSHYIDYNINALLWADARTRSGIAREGILSGRFTINETRAWENLNPKPGGDDLLIPLNMVRIDAKTGEVKPIQRSQKTRNEGDASAELRALVEVTLRRVHGRMVNQAAKIRGADRRVRVVGLLDSQRSACAEILSAPIGVVSRMVSEDINTGSVWELYAANFREACGDESGDVDSQLNSLGESIPEMTADLFA